jgi:hypothetical protein
MDSLSVAISRVVQAVLGGTLPWELQLSNLVDDIHRQPLGAGSFGQVRRRRGSKPAHEPTKYIALRLRPRPPWAGH